MCFLVGMLYFVRVICHHYDSAFSELILFMSMNLEQFFLDMHFLEEITRYGEYFSKSPLVPATLMKSVFISAGFDHIR